MVLAFVSQPGRNPVAAPRSYCLDCASDDIEDRPHPPFGQAPFPADLARREHFGRPLPDPPPLRQIPPVRDILGASFYVDANHSVADPALKRRNEAAVRPLHAYLAQIASLADGWDESRPANPGYAARLIESLDKWAGEDALLGNVNKQGAYERVWALSGLALAYLRVRDAPIVDHGERSTVENWLGRLARSVIAEFKTRGPMSGLNNHACWAATAVAAAGIAAHDKELFSWAVSTAEVALAQVRADGFLPLELQRKALALHYHLFALAPLVMMRELARANTDGRFSFDAMAGLELGRLIDRVIAGLGDSTSFAKAAGASQTIALPLRGADLAWAEIVYAQSHNPQLGAWIADARPLRDDRLGGNMTLAFGVPDLK
jgi:poly(beta-D-mannuronate) lyase